MRKTGNVFKITLSIFFGLLLLVESLAAVPVVPFQDTQILTSSEIVRLGTEYLRRNLPWDENDFEMAIEYRGKDLILPAGVVDLDFQLDGNVKRAGQIPLMAKIKVNGLLKRGVWLATSVKVYSEVVKTQRSLKRGRILTEDDVTLERVLITPAHARALTSLDEVVGFKTLRNLESDRVVTANLLVKSPLVKRGDRVRLLAKKGAMRVTTSGVVRESGFKGAYVKVENMQSKKVVYGRVIDSHTVQVEF
ncbi:MAG: flagellar basal body P-ring formation chaperone FlgA [Nitrospinota bacterium]|nr:flagellar basal body P-ring formation chaperone FlgA [Nitrospinota bacterium]